MYDFVSHVLRRYFEATGWNEHNSYLNLNAASAAILDFPTPPGVAFSISASPSPPFFTTYRLRALPSLQGNVGYIFSSTDVEHGVTLNIGHSSGRVGLKRMIERFRAPGLPTRPQGKTETWLASRRAVKRDYLLYGCMHIPSSRVDALWTTRLAPTWQAILSASSTPPRVPLSQQLSQLSGLASEQNTGYSTSNFKPTPTNLQILLQRDTGKWSTEYSYSLDDALWGFRFLHNFASREQTVRATDENGVTAKDIKSVAEDSTGWSAGGGLQGRFSAGAEFFFSSLEKSAGLSTGVRFATIPDGAENNDDMPSQAPTIITATLNPMMGHLSMAYAARMARDVAACSRFDFNVYSYDSELTLGFEYWLRSSPAPSLPVSLSRAAAQNIATEIAPASAPARPLVAALPGWSLRERPDQVSASSTAAPVSSSSLREPDSSVVAGFELADECVKDGSLQSSASSQGDEQVSTAVTASQRPSSDLIGLIKARVSSTTEISLMWQGRMRNSLVSAGCRANFNNRVKPVTSVGLEIMYFSSAADLPPVPTGQEDDVTS
ncbi:hypothetical protein K437DRAFT_256165 [Tilletiaria anomala UBC 951]|uniref:Mitochondrial distribution and morphology protein 10 n=1 Tax=Tilletiaria anomala (strain ATCC 24038 / CBS 436.72 / UBC 951) TaxID=1037660 RepID=A0A066W6P9_TILAU|nr:uncharacterized protein K437DRAFT_256165 [Tilletiaria anomala UBC 951]KDN46440.1 hypothetical protein K437DRAFT_256165 [Tilletiaria anomala UBC 951]